MIYKDDFEGAKKYWSAFWNKEMIDRPVVSITAPKKGIEMPSYYWSPTYSYNVCMDGNYQEALNKYEDVVAATYYGGEALPSFEVTLGPDQYAGFLGSKIEAGEGFYTTWAHPVVDDWSNFEVKIDQSTGSYFDKVKKYMDYAATFAKDKFFINMLDLHSNMDALSALRGPQDLCMDLYDCPEEVHRVLNEVRKTYPEVFEMAFKAGDMKNRGSIGWAPTYCGDGKFAVIQCDFSCMLSPTQAREFVIPAIAEEAAYLDHSVYHYDGKEALGHLDDVLAIKEIDCIQWVPGTGTPPTIEWMDLLQKIQKSGKSLWIYDWTAEDIKAHFKELEPNKVAFSLGVGSQDEADSLLEFLVKNT